MDPQTQPSIYREHVRWLWRRIAAAPIPDLLITGAVDSGKSTFFRELVAKQPHAGKQVVYRYWDLLRTPRARTGDGFRAQLAKSLALTAIGSIDTHLDNLSHLLNTGYPDQRVVLVLDHWDDAQENYATCVDIEALEDLHEFVRTSQHDVDDGVTARLGLIMVTRFPDTGMFLNYVYRNRGQKPGLVRISGHAERLFTNVHPFPFLGWRESKELVAGLGAHDVDGIVAACGGWVGLLAIAAQKATSGAGAVSADELDLTADIFHLLNKTLLAGIAASRECDHAQAWVHVIRDIAQGADPQAKYALPVVEDAPVHHGLDRLPRALREYLSPEPLLVVDSDGLESVLAISGETTADALFPIVEAVRQRFGIAVGGVRWWRPADGPVPLDDPRVRLVVLSDRAGSTVADAEVSTDVTVLPPGLAVAESRLVGSHSSAADITVDEGASQ
ncbi:ATP-binding protein [Nocardia harenae]|uniref:ATP-binding protein n=1 Tax=Nocardia harenae TaxID=358707 RepID=UPI00083021A9|nr:ATP-binding protein [Nocardia harenae]